MQALRNLGVQLFKSRISSGEQRIFFCYILEKKSKAIKTNYRQIQLLFLYYLYAIRKQIFAGTNFRNFGCNQQNLVLQNMIFSPLPQI